MRCATAGTRNEKPYPHACSHRSRRRMYGARRSQRRPIVRTRSSARSRRIDRESNRLSARRRADLQSAVPGVPRLLRRALSAEDAEFRRSRSGRIAGARVRQCAVAGSAADATGHRRANDRSNGARKASIRCSTSAIRHRRTTSPPACCTTCWQLKAQQSIAGGDSAGWTVRLLGRSRAVVHDARSDAEVRERASAMGHAVRVAGADVGRDAQRYAVAVGRCKGSPACAAVRMTYQRAVTEWEAFFNGASLKAQLMSRYMYEHLFLADIYFDEIGTGEHFRMVRSTTPPGQPIDIIATRRPVRRPRCGAPVLSAATQHRDAGVEDAHGVRVEREAHGSLAVAVPDAGLRRRSRCRTTRRPMRRIRF